MTGSVKDGVLAWLDKEGYPLEMRVARILARSGFEPAQSEYYGDPDTGEAREIDVVGYKVFNDAEKQTIAAAVVECKVSRDCPWVVFSAPNRIPTAAAIREHAGSGIFKNALEALCHEEQVARLRPFRLGENVGYMIVSMEKKNQSHPNSAFTAVMSAAKATVGTIARLYGSLPTVPVFAWPLVVLDGHLVEVVMAPNGEIVADEVREATLAWRRPILGGGLSHSFITICTVDAAEQVIGETSADIDCLLRLASGLPPPAK